MATSHFASFSPFRCHFQLTACTDLCQAFRGCPERSQGRGAETVMKVCISDFFACVGRRDRAVFALLFRHVRHRRPFVLPARLVQGYGGRLRWKGAPHSVADPTADPAVSHRRNQCWARTTTSCGGVSWETMLAQRKKLYAVSLCGGLAQE